MRDLQVFRNSPDRSCGPQMTAEISPTRLSRKVTDLLFMYTLWAVIPITGVIQLEKVVQNFMILAKMIHGTALALEGFQVSLNSLAKVVTDERIALDFLLMGQGGFCAISSTPCCAWVNALGQVERSIQKHGFLN